MPKYRVKHYVIYEHIFEADSAEAACEMIHWASLKDCDREYDGETVAEEIE